MTAARVAVTARLCSRETCWGGIMGDARHSMVASKEIGGGRSLGVELGQVAKMALGSKNFGNKVSC